MADKEEVEDTSDYKVSKSGRKIKAHRIIFNKGTDDGKKGISEMKKSYKDFVEQHTAELTEEQNNELIAELQEVLGKGASAGEWISDFVKSDNPKFAGKSKEKRKQMALAAFYAKQRNEEAEIEEELKGSQHKLDKNKNGKLDKHDFKLLRKEDAEQVDEAQSHQSKTTMKHVSNPTAGEKKAAKDIKPGIAGYRDRVAMLKSAEDRGALKKEETTNESVFDWKNNPRQTSDKTKTKTYHDVKKISTGTVYTKQFDKDGTSKGTGGDAAAKAENAPKRGRGRPKKDKFAEAVEFLLALSEEHFDDMMEEGFDAFIESYDQLDELSKTTLGSYAKKAAVDAKFKGFQAGHVEGDAMARSKKMYGGSGAGSDIDNKAHKRLSGVKKAIDRLTK